MSVVGTFFGVGVGPGDPQLITLKAVNAIRNADVICYLANVQGESQAKSIACDALAMLERPVQELPVVMPMSENRTIANAVYDKAALQITNHLRDGKQVVFLCEGDPLFFGSFTYLHQRLSAEFPCQVVPGISSVHAAASAFQHPITVLSESMAVVSGRHSLEQLNAALINHDSVVIMKAGRSREKILTALAETNRLSDARYIENIGRQNETQEVDVSQLEKSPGPYFSLFLVTRAQREGL